jgi:hypothetical protein
MAKEFYDVSHKTYFNTRIKPVFFQGGEMHPLYVQVTYDRKTIFFKSYYFELFAQPKYDFLGVTLAQIDELEGRAIDYFLSMAWKHFSLDGLLQQYRAISVDILDSFDDSFRRWLGVSLGVEGFPGLAGILGQPMDAVAGIRIWDDVAKILDPTIFERVEAKLLNDRHPYIPLAIYVRDKYPAGPFCLPLHEWHSIEKRVELELFLDKSFGKRNWGRMARQVRDRLYPEGFSPFRG